MSYAVKLIAADGTTWQHNKLRQIRQYGKTKQEYTNGIWNLSYEIKVTLDLFTNQTKKRHFIDIAYPPES